MNSYELSRIWFDYCFVNPDKIKPNHTAVYFFAIEHCNRLGWKEKFGFPTTMVMEALGIKSYNTYINTLNDIVNFGFIIMVEKSKNQYSANIIALSNFNKALDKALDKALIKHGTKQSESTVQSIDSIIKQINNKQYNKEQLVLIRKSIDKILESNLPVKEYSNEIKNFTNSILKYFPIPPKKINDWYEITEKLIRLDNYDLNTIEIIVKYFRADSFWNENFQSYTKLRKKNKEGIVYIDHFKQILINRTDGANKKTNSNRNTTPEGLRAIIDQFPDS